MGVSYVEPYSHHRVIVNRITVGL